MNESIPAHLASSSHVPSPREQRYLARCEKKDLMVGSPLRTPSRRRTTKVASELAHDTTVSADVEPVVEIPDTPPRPVPQAAPASPLASQAPPEPSTPPRHHSPQKPVPPPTPVAAVTPSKPATPKPATPKAASPVAPAPASAPAPAPEAVAPRPARAVPRLVHETPSTCARVWFLCLSLLSLALMVSLSAAFYLFWMCPSMKQLKRMDLPFCRRAFSDKGVDVMFAMQAYWDRYSPLVVQWYQENVPAPVKQYALSGYGGLATGITAGVLLASLLWWALTPSARARTIAEFTVRLLGRQAYYNREKGEPQFGLPDRRVRALCDWLYGPISSRQWSQIRSLVMSRRNMQEARIQGKPTQSYWYLPTARTPKPKSQ
ncbi:hypothetical protein PAPYR_2626 [Paratrimastix pyriformis]|uniref:Transmembrane protein n=1 Tax=Paratrimastix pyriformis TaxID=342808 RepID=A0ABQ8US48_9EUKA|nr:hypothetical protein PAPYR_2626 [Paratrimastix pyriformis]